VCTVPRTSPFAPFSLHDALPISNSCRPNAPNRANVDYGYLPVWYTAWQHWHTRTSYTVRLRGPAGLAAPVDKRSHRCQVGSQKRSEEHTSELQSRENLVCRLALE